MTARNDKVVFAVAPDGTGDGAPLVILGIPREAWVYMKDGKAHTFDLTKAGVPVKLMLFGAKDHAEAMQTLKQAMAVSNVPYLDERSKDFSIRPTPKTEG